MRDIITWAVIYFLAGAAMGGAIFAAYLMTQNWRW